MARTPENLPTPHPPKGPAVATKPALVIYGYTNFRKYLLDFYEFKKSGPRGYSYRSFSKAVGFSTLP